MSIYLIRHGKTEANERHLYCGSTDLPLSLAGISELAQLKERYALPKQCLVVTSGMKRTDETLSILLGDVPHRTDSDLREMDFGIFEMHSYAELANNPDYRQWISGDNENNLAPSGESGAMMKQRVWKAFCRLTADNPDVVIITHGGVIAFLMSKLFPCEEKNRYQWQPRPGHGYLIHENAYEPIPKEIPHVN